MLYREAHRILSSIVYLDRILTSGEKEEIVSQAYPLLLDDLYSFVERDPAAKGSCEYVLNSYSCFKAVMSYRLANALYYYQKNSANREVMILQQTARLMSEDVKIKTGIEIHPGAKIGSRFVIDHGVGTVIGETCEIGQECYLLQGVILGASGISRNSEGKRHPTLGDRVQIGAFTKILGAIIVGNDVKISPGCVVTQDIPPNSKIVVINEYQILKVEEYDNLNIHGITIQDNEEMWILGENLKDVSVALVDGNHNPVKGLEIEVIEENDKILRCHVRFEENNVIDFNRLRLSFNKGNNCLTTVVNSLALKKILLLKKLKFIEANI